MTQSYFRALTIAGSDSGGGAGLQADLKTFSALGCYGFSVVTALTAQNTLAVLDIHPVPEAFVATQLETVLEDIGADVVKIGMLHSPEIIHVVAKALKQYKITNVVLDPVMFAKSGDRLIRDDAINTLIQTLIPIARVLTPNLPEAAEIVRRSLKTREHMEEAAEEILAMGPKAVVIKGGHLDFGGSDDFLIFKTEKGEKESEWMPDRRVDTPNLHGAGCTFASAIASFLAQGKSIREAVSSAKLYVNGAVNSGMAYSLGEGNGPVAHFHQWWQVNPEQDSGNYQEE